MNPKPHLKLADIQAKPQSPVDVARKRHGKPFAYESSNWKPHEIPVLTAWMQAGGAGKERKP